MLVLKASTLLEREVINELNNSTAFILSKTDYLNNDINLI
jgi:hypothetical protein